MKRKQFSVVEYSSGFAIVNNQTGKQHWLSDGVDALFTKSGKAMRPGSEYFRKTWERSFNQNADETMEAYFS